MKTSIGGDRLGSGSKQEISIRHYERSTHDLSYIWRSTMASGTLVPFMSDVALPGDSFDIDLDCDVKTHPTIGPLFGSYKVQLDVFQIPLRLYNPKLQINMPKAGLDMKSIKLPQVKLVAEVPKAGITDLDNLQINSSCIFSYLGIRGLGTSSIATTNQLLDRQFSALTWLMYWDIYYAYYANKQEEIGAVIHNPLTPNDMVINTVALMGSSGTLFIVEGNTWGDNITNYEINPTTVLRIDFTEYEEFDPNTFYIWVNGYKIPAFQIWQEWEYNAEQGWGQFTNPVPEFQHVRPLGYWDISLVNRNWNNTEPRIETFPLENINQMKMDIISNITSPEAFVIQAGNYYAPYDLALKSLDLAPLGENQTIFSKQSSQEGLALKTYQSDLFNNWLNTEYIEGENGINAITAVDVSDGFLSLDALNLAGKVYEMLNRVAVSGGTYYDWLDATWDHETIKGIQTPMYLGGLSKELVFQEVVSNATSSDGQPLGTLAGRGVLSNKHKGGSIKVRVDEPSIIMGIVSLTPRLDYSQGNKWHVNLKTMDDFHKPALDGIGFQDLITDQMAWWDTGISPVNGAVIFHSAGKQPAWLNYMTNVNEVRGNFANQSEQMFMVLNRRYEPKNKNAGEELYTIEDLTTYIDPTKFNHIFADTRLDAQNFWVQIAVDNYARRKMSAKQIPNL